jgi:hypothetical protein
MHFSDLFARRWVCARACYPNPEPTNLLRAILTCIWDGGELAFVG